MEGRLPSGRVTFAFTDVVSSTRTFTEHGDAYVEAVQALQAEVARHAERHGGVVVNTEGDGTFLAFPSAKGAVDALTALVEVVDATAARGDGPALRVRAGAHTGEATPIGDDYFALPVHVAARVSTAASAGQVFVSQSVIDDVGTTGEPLGTFDLKDIAEPVTLWRVAGDGASPRAMPTRRTNVAVPHTSFIGRAAELDELARMLERPGLVTLVGPGGLGKTRLASELALRNADQIPAGAWLVELAPVSDPTEVAARVAGTLGMEGSAGARAVVDELLRRGHVLLVLDNCEHVVDACADLVADLLDGCPELRLLCTSREALEVDGEHVVRLAPLGTSTGTGPDPTATGAAEALFISRAEAAGAVVGERDLASITEVCRHLDGLPLALELAAARAATIPLAGLASALVAGDIGLRRRGGEERQRSLDALVEWSLRLLDDGEHTALLALSVFPGRFSGDMADSVLHDVPHAAAGAAGALTRRSLLDLDGDHYRMLVTTRDVVRRELVADPDLHAAAMAGLFAWSRVRSQNPTIVSDLTADEVQTLQAGLDWALRHQLSGRGEVMDRLVQWELSRNRTATSLDLATRALAGPDPVTADEVVLQVSAVRLLSGMGSSSESVPLDQIERIVAIGLSLDDVGVRARALRLQAMVLDGAGDHDRAASLLEEALALDDLPDADRSLNLLDLGVSLHLNGDLEEAEEYYRRCVQLIDPKDLNHTLVVANLGELLLDMGRFEDAVEVLRRAVREGISRPNVRAWTTALLVEAEGRRGNLDIAYALAEHAEADLARAIETDSSLASVRDRMRAAMASLDGETSLPTRRS